MLNTALIWHKFQFEVLPLLNGRILPLKAITKLLHFPVRQAIIESEVNYGLDNGRLRVMPACRHVPWPDLERCPKRDLTLPPLEILQHQRPSVRHAAWPPPSLSVLPHRKARSAPRIGA